MTEIPYLQQQSKQLQIEQELELGRRTQRELDKRRSMELELVLGCNCNCSFGMKADKSCRARMPCWGLMPPLVWKPLGQKREQGPELGQPQLVLVLGQQRLVLLLEQQRLVLLQEMQPELLLGHLLQLHLGLLLLQQLLLLLERVPRRMQRQWQELAKEMKLGMASLIYPVQSFLCCTLKQMSTYTISLLVSLYFYSTIIDIYRELIGA